MVGQFHGTPQDQLHRISEIVESGRRQMDDYRCIIENRHQWSWKQPPEVVYRKGNRFCMCNLYWPGDYPLPKQPAAGADMGLWWRRRLRKFRHYPSAIHNCDALYYIRRPGSMDINPENHLDVASVSRSEMKFRITTWLGQDSSPELVCRPDLMVAIPGYDAVLNDDCADGPDGSLFLRVHRTSFECNTRCKPSMPGKYRFWLDPSRDFVAVRHDIITEPEPGRLDLSQANPKAEFFLAA